ncbi:MAG TPA: hypothetical protein VIH15_01965 [Casimicrobiaceae bacterium]|jgi:hypothetical protein
MKCMANFLATLIASAAGAAMLGACATVQAHWPAEPAAVEIYDRTEGRVLPTYTHEGRRYVVGKPGNEYSIRVRNQSGGRVLTVMSVDGVNAISGDTASPAQTGYVLSPYESADIAGWRKSMSHTAAFYFTTLPDSYAARTGRPDNVGVIGVAVFRERPRPVVMQQFERREAARDATEPTAKAAKPSAAGALASDAAAAPQPSLGTGHGRSESSYASYTQFERASATPEQTITIYYDSYPNLLAQGVPVGVPPIARLRPDPFPDRGRFAPDPR